MIRGCCRILVKFRGLGGEIGLVRIEIDWYGFLAREVKDLCAESEFLDLRSICCWAENCGKSTLKG